MAVDSDYVRVADLDDLESQGELVVSADNQAIALFHHEGEVYAVDNRCPHMGFPLIRGSVEEGVLTCHWHHARFELEEGDTFDPWADDVQTFPVALDADDGGVYLDPHPEPDVPPATRWRNRLADGLQHDLSLVQAKAILGLDTYGDGFHTPLETAVNFGTKYRDMGWGRGLTTLGAMANLHGQVAPDEQRRAMWVGVREVADECAGEPPRFAQYRFDNDDLGKARLKSWFRRTCEVRDADGAERCVLTAVDNLAPDEVAEIMVAAATDHLYMNAGHTLDFINKAFETLDHVGWDEHAGPVLASTVRQITDGGRSEELSSWRQPVDIADLVFDAHDLLDDLVAAGAGKEWVRPNDFVDTLLSDDPEAIIDALTDAIRDGATSEQLTRAVATAATRRVAWFATSNEFNDWNTVHHTFTYANAAHKLSLRTDADEVYRACFDAAMSVYLDRFLNSPRAPLPSPGETDRDPETIRTELLDAFDEQGNTETVAKLVGEHIDADGEVAALKESLGEALLREDAGFHTLQNVEAAFERYEHAGTDEERRLAMLATARYMAAHFPTRRSNEQTFRIALQLHRGEKVHGE